MYQFANLLLPEYDACDFSKTLLLWRMLKTFYHFYMDEMDEDYMEGMKWMRITLNGR